MSPACARLTESSPVCSSLGSRHVSYVRHQHWSRHLRRNMTPIDAAGLEFSWCAALAPLYGVSRVSSSAHYARSGGAGASVVRSARASPTRVAGAPSDAPAQIRRRNAPRWLRLFRVAPRARTFRFYNRRSAPVRFDLRRRRSLFMRRSASIRIDSRASTSSFSACPCRQP